MAVTVHSGVLVRLQILSNHKSVNLLRYYAFYSSAYDPVKQSCSLDIMYIIPRLVIL